MSPIVSVVSNRHNVAFEADRKPSKFTLRRSGSTKAPLTVKYSIGGTAANGKDYERLSGVRTIPAGSDSAVIALVPKNDDVPEGDETVVLSLKRNDYYRLGSSPRAEIVIQDND